MAVMSYADYEICPGCDRKALYMGDREAPEGIEVWHASCRAEYGAAAAPPETLLLRVWDDIQELARDYSRDDAIAALPFLATLDQLLMEKYGVRTP